MLRDLHWAGRSLARLRIFTVVAVFTLALGIGANAAVFSVLQAVVFRPLPYEDPNRLMLLWNRFESTGAEKVPIAIPEVPLFEERSRLFTGFAAATRITDAILTGRERSEHVQLTRATEDLFPLLGAEVVTGRLFRREDDMVQPELDEGSDAEIPATPVLMSHGLWQRSFGGDPQMAGRALRLNGWPVGTVWRARRHRR